ncbi:MAG TPA: response regulator [Vicinamibacterales bacterium]
MNEKTTAPAQRLRPDWIRHEIRNPLNVLTGALRLIEMSGVTPQQQKQIDMCRSAIERIGGILDGLTGSASEFAAEAAAELRALGGVTFLAKPFERSDLLRTVQLAARTHRNLRLLSADDVPEVGWLLESLLASSGCTLEVVRDGSAAVERARADTFSAILLDLDMPGMNGVEAARAIRGNERADGRDPVPIVIVSGHDLEKAAEDAAAGRGDGQAGDDDGEVVVSPDPEVAPLVPEFLSNRRGDIARMQAFIDDADWEALRSLGHKMKGTGRGYGFSRITDIGKAIEEAGTKEDAEGARAAATALARYLDRVRIVPADPGQA